MTFYTITEIIIVVERRLGIGDVIVFAHRVCEERDCHQVAQHIFKSDTLGNKNIEFCIGNGGGSIIKTPEEWKRFHMEYFYRMFHNSGNVLLTELRKLYQASADEIKKTTELVAIIFEKLFSNERNDRGSFVIAQYDLEEYASFLGYRGKKWNTLKEELVIDDFGDRENRILAICPERSTIFNIRVTDSADMAEVLKEFEFCDNDLKMLCKLNEDILRDSGMVLLGLVSAPNLLEDEEKLLHEMCGLLFLSSSTVANETVLSEWVRKFDRSCHAFCTDYALTEPSVEQQKKVLELISSVLCFMATCPVYTYLPVLSLDKDKQIHSITLNQQQINVLNCKERKILVKGNYGSGKTVVGKIKLRQLAKHCQTKTVCYYLCLDAWSLLDHEVKMYVDDFVDLDGNKCNMFVKNKTELIEDLHLKEMAFAPLSMILFRLWEKHEKDNCLLHFIIDEYDGEMLTEGEALLLRALFDHKLKHSTIVIMAQSLEKKRSDHDGNATVAHKNYQYAGTGLKVFELEKCMRTTVQIHDFISTVQDEVENTSNEYNLPYIYRCFEIEWTLGALVESDEIDVVEKSHESLNMINNEQDQEPESSTSNTIDHQVHNEPLFCEAEFDLDTAHKLLSNSRDDGSRKTTTTFKFASPAKIGHHVESNLPTVIFPLHNNRLYSSVNDCSVNVFNILKLTLALSEYIFKPKVPVETVFLATGLKIIILQPAFMVIDKFESSPVILTSQRSKNFSNFSYVH